MIISKLRELSLSCVASAGISCAAHGASTYDVVRDFSLKANPNGVWSYQGTTTLAYAHHQYQGVSGLDNWSDDNQQPNNVSIVRNKTGAPVVLYDGDMTLPTNYLAIESGNADNANVVFQASSAGTYTIKGNFIGLDAKEAGYTTCYVIENGKDYLVGKFAKPHKKITFDLNVALAAGDTITFQVESNPHTKHARHDVGLTAKITGP